MLKWETLCLLVAIDKHCDYQMSTKVDITGNVWLTITAQILKNTT